MVVASSYRYGDVTIGEHKSQLVINGHAYFNDEGTFGKGYVFVLGL